MLYIWRINSKNSLQKLECVVSIILNSQLWIVSGKTGLSSILFGINLFTVQNLQEFKRLCSYLKQYQTINGMGWLTNMIKLKGRNYSTKQIEHITSFLVVQSINGFIWLALCLKVKGWGANSICFACIRFRSTYLSSVAHQEEKLPLTLHFSTEKSR